MTLTAGCATTTVTNVVSDYCAVAEMINPSRSDTEETLRQVARENTKYENLCLSGFGEDD